MCRTRGGSTAIEEKTTAMLIRPTVLGGLLALALAGCTTTKQDAGPKTSWRLRLKPTEKLAPDMIGRDLRRGANCALIAFNTVAVVGDLAATPPASALEGDNPTPGGLIPGIELRDLTDAMLATFLTEFSTIPDLNVMPIRRVAANNYYRRLPHAAGGVRNGVAAEPGLARLMAPSGLCYIPVPQSRGDTFLHGGAKSLPYAAAGIGSDFENRMNLLTHGLGVDFVVLVNNRVRLTPKFSRGWGAELELLEVVVIGKRSFRRFAFAEYVGGRFAADPAADAADPAIPPAVLALMNTKGTPHLATVAFGPNRYWRTIKAPYRQAAQLMVKRLSSLRR